MRALGAEKVCIPIFMVTKNATLADMLQIDSPLKLIQCHTLALKIPITIHSHLGFDSHAPRATTPSDFEETAYLCRFRHQFSHMPTISRLPMSPFGELDTKQGHVVNK